ncbi:hypothetical protein RO3G_00096 [Rhizopus delemar RA 99-880]|uniref:Uncharacterized protein n=1 Tax=Rhizopus delemar (strain RA 99-880 / ATCC MYA-4621 / FGSC 9543 / NRRL 43880) TaxID=246409 RepID=I1BGR2_RHIO9|nr:hypothetical protein RO3G_00096 [Rhizopus delemar RA 99-880]|eukprot:EIE75392.1 hypothetical protein RO3G_00096 [Rhizopus delemar RA 99-880]
MQAKLVTLVNKEIGTRRELDTRLGLAEPVHQLVSKRGGFRRDLAMMEVVEFE